MKWIACLAFVVGCQRGDAGAPGGDRAAARPPAAASTASSGYAKDIDALCNSVALSGADKIDPDARQLTIANWLGANLKTPESRTFLVRIQPLVGDAKAQALEAEAQRVGLPGCALAAEWRTPR